MDILSELMILIGCTSNGRYLIPWLGYISSPPLHPYCLFLLCTWRSTFCCATVDTGVCWTAGVISPVDREAEGEGKGEGGDDEVLLG